MMQQMEIYNQGRKQMVSVPRSRPFNCNNPRQDAGRGIFHFIQQAPDVSSE